MRVLPVICLLLLVGCNAWTTTKQYYDDYINPRAAISYDVDSFSKLPQEFLDQYYRIDNKVASVVNILNRNEAGLTEEQLAEIRSAYPWVSQISVFDHVYTCMYGSVGLCNDSSIPELLGSLKPVNTTVALNSENRVLICNNVTSKDKQSRNIVFLLDLERLRLAEAPRVAFVVDGKMIAGATDILADYTATVADLSKKKSYSGSFSQDARKVYWVRSMASERVFYFYSK